MEQSRNFDEYNFDELMVAFIGNTLRGKISEGGGVGRFFHTLEQKSSHCVLMEVQETGTVYWSG